VLAICCAGCAVRPTLRVEVPQEALARTDAHALGGTWRNRTMLCVGPEGTVTETSTTRTSGDPGLDQLYRDALAQWQYTPRSSRSRACKEIEFTEDFGKDRTPKRLAKKCTAACGKGKGKAEVIYKPEPPVAAAARIFKAAKINDWRFTSRTAFCVETDGTVSEVETLRSTGLAELDRLARASVATWQFRPYMVDGVPRRLCSEVTFTFGSQ